MKKRVMVAMSGGVDSSVTAALLLEQGYEVMGGTMKLWEGSVPERVVADAARVAGQLGIPHHVFSLGELFQTKVIDYFRGEYFQGRTPNPCVVCNRYLKFGSLLAKARELGCDYLATGHYVRSVYDEARQIYTLRKGVDPKRDQSYFLFNLTPKQLAQTLFPLGEFTKLAVREKARGFGLPVAQKPDSQEICFIPDGNYVSFIQNTCPQQAVPGRIIDLQGNHLGTHQGIIHYTIGQRKGLGIAATKPLYVVDIRPQTNEVVVGDNEAISAPGLIATNLNWLLPLAEIEAEPVAVKIRSTAQPVTAKLSWQNDQESLAVIFEKPQRAVTQGQAAVFYRNDLVIGGGIIEKSIN